MQRITNVALNLAERGWVTDAVIRQGIRHLLRQRLCEIEGGDHEPVAVKEKQPIE